MLDVALGGDSGAGDFAWTVKLLYFLHLSLKLFEVTIINLKVLGLLLLEK